jgi:hypothetical protein
MVEERRWSNFCGGGRGGVDWWWDVQLVLGKFRIVVCAAGTTGRQKNPPAALTEAILVIWCI